MDTVWLGGCKYTYDIVSIFVDTLNDTKGKVMKNKFIKHRERIKTLLNEPSVYPQQRNPTRSTYNTQQRK
jgi:hypothetical protein